MSQALATQAEIAAARAAHPAAFGPPLWRRLLVAGGLLLAAAYLVSLAARLGFTPERFAVGGDKLGVIVSRMIPPSDDGFFWRIAGAIGETVAMALIGTVLAVLLALPLGFLGAKTVVKNGVIHFGLRRVFDFFRGVPTLIWALIFVRATGLGPMAGILAMVASDLAALAKLNAEAIENADRRPVEGIAATGAPGIVTLRLGVLTQVLPVMVSQALYAFESNVRSAAILGVVGAGGIGFELQERIRIMEWDQVAFIILLFLVVVALIDWLSQILRQRLIRAGLAAPMPPLKSKI
jgi:phosphonate transport system permease protein